MVAAANTLHTSLLVPGNPGERVTLLRGRKGWTQAELAERAGLSVKTVSNVELGKSVHGATLHALATALGCSVSYLFSPIA